MLSVYPTWICRKTAPWPRYIINCVRPWVCHKIIPQIIIRYIIDFESKSVFIKPSVCNFNYIFVHSLTYQKWVSEWWNCECIDFDVNSEYLYFGNMTWQWKESLLVMLMETEIMATTACISVTKLCILIVYHIWEKLVIYFYGNYYLYVFWELFLLNMFLSYPNSTIMNNTICLQTIEIKTHLKNNLYYCLFYATQFPNSPT